jgi:hypothetical protein
VTANEIVDGVGARPIEHRRYIWRADSAVTVDARLNRGGPVDIAAADASGRSPSSPPPSKMSFVSALRQTPSR